MSKSKILFATALALGVASSVSAQQQPPAPPQLPQAPNMTFFVTGAGPGKGADLGGIEGADPASVAFDAVSAGVENEVDVVIVAGDVFDSAAPAAACYGLLSDSLRALSDTGATVIVTSGNHDSAARLGFQSALLRDMLPDEELAADIYAATDAMTAAAGRPRRAVHPVGHVEDLLGLATGTIKLGIMD